MLAVMLREHYDDGTVMPRKEIGDELLTLLVAGHENVAVTLAWVFERISRHPELLTELTAEAGAGGSPLHTGRRSRRCSGSASPSTSSATRRRPDHQDRAWMIPRDCSVTVAIDQIHRSPDVFPDSDCVHPQRFLKNTTSPSTFEWLPDGGSGRRCRGLVVCRLGDGRGAANHAAA